LRRSGSSEVARNRVRGLNREKVAADLEKHRAPASLAYGEHRQEVRVADGVEAENTGPADHVETGEAMVSHRDDVDASECSWRDARLLGSAIPACLACRVRRIELHNPKRIQTTRPFQRPRGLTGARAKGTGKPGKNVEPAKSEAAAKKSLTDRELETTNSLPRRRTRESR